MLVPKLWCSLSAGTISIGRDAIMSCCAGFVKWQQFEVWVVIIFASRVRAPTPPARGRALSLPWGLGLASCLANGFGILRGGGVTLLLCAGTAEDIGGRRARHYSR